MDYKQNEENAFDGGGRFDDVKTDTYIKLGKGIIGQAKKTAERYISDGDENLNDFYLRLKIIDIVSINMNMK